MVWQSRNTKTIMKKFLSVCIADDGVPVIESEAEFSQDELKTSKVDRKSDFYRSLVRALQSCDPNVFKVIRILDKARSEARFEEYQGLHPDLEEALIAWRGKKAKADGKPAYIILSQRALINIADSVPSTKEELLGLPGVGEKLYENYGEEILDITSGCF